MSTNQCLQAPTTLPPADAATGTAIALKGLGLQPCTTTSVAGGGVSIIPPIAVAVGGTSSSGCEQISVISNSIGIAQNQVTCILNSTTAAQTTAIQQSNSITVNVTGVNALITISQTNQAAVNATATLTAQQKSSIGSALTNSATSLISDLQNVKSGYLSAPNSQKAVATLSTFLQSNQVQQLVDQAIADNTFSLLQNNNITINITGADYFSATSQPYSTVNLTQQNVASYQASLIVGSFYDQLFKTDAASALKSVVQTNQTSTAEGVDIGALFSPLIITMVLIAAAVLAFLVFGGSSINTVLKYIIPITIVAAVIVAVVYAVKKDAVTAAAAGITAVLLGVFEFFSVGKSTAPRKIIK